MVSVACQWLPIYSVAKSGGVSSEARSPSLDTREPVLISVAAGVTLSQIFKARVVRQIGQMHNAGRPVALLGDNDFRLALQVFILAVVILLAMDERHHIGILLDRPRLAQV